LAVNKPEKGLPDFLIFKIQTVPVESVAAPYRLRRPSYDLATLRSLLCQLFLPVRLAPNLRSIFLK